MDIKRTKGYVAIAGLGFIAGVAITGTRAELNLSKVPQDLADRGLRIDRCPEGVEVKKIEDFPCREVGSTADGVPK